MMLKVTYRVNRKIPETTSNWIYVMLLFPPKGFRGYKQQDNAINEQKAASHKWFTNSVKRQWTGNLQRTLRKSSLTKQTKDEKGFCH